MKSSENQALPEHKSWNHKISFKKKVTSEKLSIYQLSSEKLQELQNYLNSNLQRKYIQHFTSETEYSVIFVLKKMKNSFSNKIQTIWISSYIIQINKHISNISRINQSCAVWSSEQVCYHILKQHTNILQEQKKSQEAC